ncbi:TPA: SPFH/Band 7/PHB domain protein [Candidatus Shapirobacteria bacterium]|uniref:Band 7 protein n=1 Tax=Candidatus Shapirobacteria bacterium GW2011_GWE2_38_30 TaxID=1618490 RepID=A0A0G0JNQ9_9BACT|nr:MAG: Band 7 protein [Candidatus Shapirobacteria bacterium GW2011_GWE2_38_30]HAP37691.1 SPFH/Band 7/PHB domain protein [Candidatus Shapirobacteria bacterium]HCU54972.1 SPFH/Band 7/PHB domain protein [Candidatus Shapirobacteria bacterium]
MFGSYFTFALFAIAILALVKSLKIVKQYEKGLVVRLGRYSHTVDSGIVFLIPFIDSVILVDMREQVINVEPQKVITKDNVGVVVDAVIYYKVVDPVKAEFEIQNFAYAATTLAQTNLRNLIGDKTLDESLTARDTINTSLRLILDEATNAWGVKVAKVELQKIDPPQDITDSMSRQMKAEREKRALILEAEGIRQSDILKAEGAAQARLLRANAEAKSIEVVAKSAESNFTQRAEKLRQLEVAEKVLGGESTKYVLPTSGQLVSVLNLDGDSKILPLK